MWLKAITAYVKEVIRTEDVMIGMYVPCSAGLIYFFEVMIRNEVLHVDSSN
jgi:hypothetical protein